MELQGRRLEEMTIREVYIVSNRSEGVDYNTVCAGKYEFMLEVPGEYTEVSVNPSFTSAHGEVQYAAQGVLPDGRSVTALLVKSSFVPENPQNNMLLPVYQIFIDNDTHEIFHANMIAGQFYEGFEMPEEKLLLYFGVPMTEASTFENNQDLLVTDGPADVISSASQSFDDCVTGATPVGNDTSRAVRDCFTCAAEYYLAQ